MAINGKGISGVLGDVLIEAEPDAIQVAEVKKWSATFKANIAKYNSNKTGGFKHAVSGAHDGSGNMDCIYDIAIPPTSVFSEGSYLTLNLQTTIGQQFIVPACISNIKIDVDLDNGDPVSWSSDFETNEDWVVAPPIVGLAGPFPGPAAAAAGTPDTAGAPAGREELLRQATAVGLGERVVQLPRFPSDVDRWRWRRQHPTVPAPGAAGTPAPQPAPATGSLAAADWQRLAGQPPQERAAAARAAAHATAPAPPGLSEEDIARIVRQVMAQGAA